MTCGLFNLNAASVSPPSPAARCGWAEDCCRWSSRTKLGLNIPTWGRSTFPRTLWTHRRAAGTELGEEQRSNCSSFVWGAVVRLVPWVQRGTAATGVVFIPREWLYGIFTWYKDQRGFQLNNDNHKHLNLWIELHIVSSQIIKKWTGLVPV